MTLAQWMRDSLGDEPDATYVHYEGPYRIVRPCCQEDHQHDQIRQAPLSAAERRDAQETVVAHETAEQWWAWRQGAARGIAPAREGADGRGLAPAETPQQRGEPD